MYSDDVVEKVKNLKPSVRGELEITDLNSEYLKNGNLSLELMGRGYAWFDTGTCEMFFEASNFVRSVENRQGLMISNIEEIAYRIGYIDKNKLSKIVEDLGENYYKEYLLKKVLNG
jgi:glucose-1-phosphate thymidylyltransferase